MSQFDTSKNMPIEEVVLERIRREIKRRGHELESPTVVLRTIRNTINAADLSEHEREFLFKLRGGSDGGGTDEVARVLAHRVRGALGDGYRTAAKEVEIEELLVAPSVYMVRRKEKSSEEEHSTQFAGAMDEARDELSRMTEDWSAEQSEGDSGLLVLAEDEIFDRIRERILELQGDGESSVAFFQKDETESLDGFKRVPASVEVVRVEGEESSLEKRIISMLRDAEAPRIDGGQRGPDPLVGTLFHNKYRITRCIGEGGFGSVYEAVDERGAGNRVAIKIMRPDREGMQGLSSFKDEARRVTRLNHPNIVDWKVFDETAEGMQYFVMELLEGEELDLIIRKEGQIEPMRAARILLEITDALRAAHTLEGGRSVLHLDLKPRNVFIVRARGTRAEHVKVFDFGIGQFIGGEEEEELPQLESGDTSDEDTAFILDASPRTLTFTGAAGGARMLKDAQGRSFRRCVSCTPEFASPEQCTHILGTDDMVPLDGRSDLYSLGIAAYLMLTGEYPFPRPVVRVDLLRIHCEDEFRQLTGYDKHIPKPLARWVDRCMAKDRESRFDDADEAYRVLKSFVEPSTLKSALPVLVPIAALVLVLITWLAWRDVPVRGDLPDSLVLGPSKLTGQLPISILDVRDIDAMPPEGSTVRVYRKGTENAIEGLSAQVGPPGVVSFSADSDWSPPDENDTLRVQLWFDEGRVRVKPFDLVWVPADSWQIASMQLAGHDVNSIGKGLVAPAGLKLRVAIAGPMRDHVKRVVLLTADFSGNGEVRTKGDERIFTFQLDDFALRGDSAEFSIRAVDAAERIAKREIQLNLTHTALQLEGSVRLVDRDQENAALSTVANRFRVTKESRAALSLSSSSLADLKWWVVKDGEPVHTDDQKGRRDFLVPLEFLSGLNGGDSYQGKIEFELSDDAHVLRSKPEKVGRFVEFEYSNARAGYIASIFGKILTEDSPTFSNKSRLTVERDGNASMRIDVTVVNERGDPIGETHKGYRLKRPSNHQEDFQLNLEDGHYLVRVQAFEYSSTGDVTSEAPDQNEEYELIIDTEYDVVSMEEIDGRLFKAGDSIEAISVRVAAMNEYPSPVELQLFINEARIGQNLGPVLPGEDLQLLKLDSAWPGDAEDGLYIVRIQGSDVAGNPVDPAEVEVEVARSGPSWDLMLPRRGLWQFDSNGDWVINLRAIDANGVASATCEIRPEAGGAPLIENLIADKATSAQERSYTGRIHFPYDWSDKSVQLIVTLEDRHGNSETYTRDGFYIDRIAPPKPDRIAVVMEAPVTAMRLVPGNDGFDYLFGGRDDFKENELYERAEIGRFNSRQGKRSWGIKYSQFAIDDYYLDESEVTVGQFLNFLRDSGGWMLTELWLRPGHEARRVYLEQRLATFDAKESVTGVTWDEAWAYATWVGKRLPSWVEWEYCVRGGQSYRPFASYREVGTVSASLGSHAYEDSTETGIRGLCSGASEWTSTPTSFDREESSGNLNWDDIAKKHPAGLLAPVRADLYRSPKFRWVGGYSDNSFDFAFADWGNRDDTTLDHGFRCALSLKDYRASLAVFDPEKTGTRRFEELDS